MGILKPLAVAVMSVAMLAAAHAGDNSCRGVTSVKKDFVYVTERPDLRSNPPMPPCRAPLSSAIGKRILASCPVGSDCTVEMPLEGKTQDSKGTILRVEAITNDAVQAAAHDIVRHKKCGIAISEARLQQIKALDQRFSAPLADDVKRVTKFANSYADFCK
jgi:hypothetical protein